MLVRLKVSIAAAPKPQLTPDAAAGSTQCCCFYHCSVAVELLPSAHLLSLAPISEPIGVLCPAWCVANTLTSAACSFLCHLPNCKDKKRNERIVADFDCVTQVANSLQVSELKH